MEYFVLYVLMIMDKVITAQEYLIKIGITTTVFLAVAFVIVAIGTAQNKDQNGTVTGLPHAPAVRSIGRYMRYSVILTVIVMVLSAITPTTKQTATIIGGGMAYSALTSDPAKELGTKAYDIVKQLMEDYANELKPANVVPANKKPDTTQPEAEASS